uniref:Uncharacterized protein n=1 Tax=Oryza sativa subsp. japonica TaxID=39947 RepID=Q75I62_ORYSJ|nr:hypothetical protein [Oryza sativa Japonica Group]
MQLQQCRHGLHSTDNFNFFIIMEKMNVKERYQCTVKRVIENGRYQRREKKGRRHYCGGVRIV